jgi:hypothetical protein
MATMLLEWWNHMTNGRKPITHGELEDSGELPSSPTDVAERIADDILSAKADLLTDREFLGNIFRHAISGSSSFPREAGGGMEKKISRHAMKGRTEHVKVHLYLSESELRMLRSFVTQRGDRNESDLVNEIVCKALSSMRVI